MAVNEATALSQLPELTRVHEFLEAFEKARARTPEVPLERFVPEPGNPLRAEVLHELIRIDLEHGWARGQPRTLSQYQDWYPEAFEDPDCAAELAFEEYRQRLQAGEQPDPADYAQRFGVNTGDWPSTAGERTPAHQMQTERVAAVPLPIESAALVYRSQFGSALQLEQDSASGLADGEDVFRELHEADPAEAERVAKAVTTLPEVGSRLGTFDLVGELGRGAFGRVFLARQTDLADRCVALKVSADLMGESQALAQMLHANVMPIYGCQRFGPFEAIWMPYLGSTTLADVLEEIEGRGDLPVSGKGLVSTLRDMGTSKLRSTLDSSAEAAPARPDFQPNLPVLRRGASHFTLDLLEKYSYVDAVLWLGTRLADGLAHAHEHGIQHRDLKPANILLSDEGQPILLDFNLASDTKLRGCPAAARIGGTLPYMSPEQLRAMNGDKPQVDERSDVFSLGIILYELLTGRHPYSLMPGRARVILPGLIAERCRPPLPPHRFNREITPAVESIILKCLAAEPAQRYQSARELQEDLQRQLASRPLRYAPEPSWRERAAKWARRHPRLTSSTSVGSVAAVGLLILATVLASALWQIKEANALRVEETFGQEAAEEFLNLSAHAEDPVQHRNVVELGEKSLEVFDFPKQQNWQSSVHYRWLPADKQERLQHQAGRLLFAMSRASLLDASIVEPERRSERLEEALRFNTLATAAFATSDPPRAFLKQRAEIVQALGQPAEAKTLLEEFQNRHDIGTLDQLLSAREDVLAGRFRDAFPKLVDVTQREPKDLQAWFLRARCHDEFGQDRDAVLAYSTCLALQPASARLWFNRGIAFLRQKDHEQARRDLDRAIELGPSNGEAWFNRGVAAVGKADWIMSPKKKKDDFEVRRASAKAVYQTALADFTKAKDKGYSSTRVHFSRARVYQQLGNEAAAKQERDEGFRHEPTDFRSWNVRAIAQRESAPDKALADVEQALRFDPRSRPALELKAELLSEKLGRTEEAVKVLDQLLKEHPDKTAMRSSRGVLLARLGQRVEAHRDAEEALLRDRSADIQYQVAGIYALTSKTHPEDEKSAFSLLSAALSQGYGLDLLDSDPDLDPIRSRPEFNRLLEAARTLRNQPQPSP